MLLTAQDHRLLDAILGVHAPWGIESAELHPRDARVEVRLAHAAGAIWACPECETVLPSDGHTERVWRHLDLCQFQTFVHARVPRVACPRHAAHDVRVPWAEAGSLYTAAMERCIGELTDSAGVSAASRALQVHWTDGLRVMMARRTGA